MNRLIEIINETTESLRKGDVVTGEPLESHKGVTHIYLMRHVDEFAGEKVDLHFIVVGVDLAKAQDRKEELRELLREYAAQHPRFLEGTSYLEVGAEIGSQELAFRLFALGKVLGFWDIITPERLGVTGDLVDELAGRGFIMTVDHVWHRK